MVVVEALERGHADRDDSVCTKVLAAEAILFASGAPLPVARLARLLDITETEAEEVLTRLSDELEGRGICLMRHADHVQLGTAPHLADVVARLWETGARPRLSTAALETMAIIAYRQPITRAQIEAIRGVNCDRAIATLLNRDMIEEVGRLETAGRPMQYGTGFAFLEHFGLRSLDELPALRLPDAHQEERLDAGLQTS